MDREEVKLRMVAARTLAGVSQKQLGKHFKADELKQEDAGKLERQEKDLKDGHIDSMVRHLGVPREWFTEPDLRAWIRSSAQEPAAGQGEVVDRLIRIEEAVGSLAAVEGRGQVSPPSQQEPQPSSDSAEGASRND